MALSVLLPELSTTGSNGFVMLNVYDLMYTWPDPPEQAGLSCVCVLLSQLGREFPRKATDSIVEYLDCDLFFFQHATKKSLAQSGRELAKLTAELETKPGKLIGRIRE